MVQRHMGHHPDAAADALNPQGLTLLGLPEYESSRTRQGNHQVD